MANDFLVVKIENFPVSEKHNMIFDTEKILNGVVQYLTIGASIKYGAVYVTLEADDAIILQHHTDGMRWQGAILRSHLCEVPVWYAFPQDRVKKGVKPEIYVDDSIEDVSMVIKEDSSES